MRSQALLIPVSMENIFLLLLRPGILPPFLFAFLPLIV